MSLDRSLGTGGRPHQLPVTACLAVVRVAHCLEAGLAVVVLLTAWKQVLQSFRCCLLTAWKQVSQSSCCSLLGSRSCSRSVVICSLLGSRSRSRRVEHWGTATPAAQKRSNTKCKGLRKGCRCLVNKIVFDGEATLCSC